MHTQLGNLVHCNIFQSSALLCVYKRHLRLLNDHLDGNILHLCAIFLMQELPYFELKFRMIYRIYAGYLSMFLALI